MDVQVEPLHADFVNQSVNLSLQLIREKNTGTDLSSPETGRAGFVNVDIHGRAHTLARDLHQSKLAQWQDIVACTVILHVLAHALVEHLPVFG